MHSRLLLLESLAREMAKILPPHEVEAFVEEARDHLAAAVAARIELEIPPEIAETEAVAAFGPIGRVVRHAAAVRRGRWHTPMLAALTVFGAVWLPLALSGRSDLFTLAALAFLVLIVPFAMACETRRPWRSLLGSAAAFWLLSTGLLAAFCGPYAGYLTGRGTLAGIADFYESYAEARVRREAKYDRLGWSEPGLRSRTEHDRASFATMGAVARRASTTLDLGGSARTAGLSTVAFALYLALLYALGAWCERLASRDRGRWGLWRAE